ncbi:B12-binding domain-containing radical SAM protein [Nonomuraea bangladeshensis]|uniref:B12-binding domain-containing radical SAM protein n=1 Tax=Nonomuraea bangladeshensis TaxID=404385 RepID=UPI0031D030C3
MKVLLIATNRERRPSFAVPAGVAYLQTALIDAGHEARILDLCFDPDDRLEGRVTEAIGEYGPDLIGVSVRNIDNETYLQYRGNLGDVKIVLGACRAASAAPVVLGGSAFSLMPVEIMNVLGADLGVIGEGEPAMVAIADALAEGRPITDAPGLLRREGTRVSVSEPARVSDPGSIVAPRYFVPDSRYFSTQVVGPQPTYGIQTKRGCAFRCSYCPVPSIEGKRFRLRSPAHIVDEMRHVRDLAGVRRFFITDSIFNLPRRHAIAVCEEMVAADLGVTWMAYTNPLQYDDDLALLFKRAGCETLNFGLDAGCDEMLTSLQKDFTVADIENATACARRAGVRIIHSLLLGGPGETADTVARTLDTMDRCAPDILTIAFGIRVYPKTPLWQDIGSRPGRPDLDMLQAVFYVDEALGPAECRTILRSIEEFVETHPKIMVRMNFDPKNLEAEVSTSSLRISAQAGAGRKAR